MMGPENVRESGHEEKPRGDLGLTAFRYIAAEMSANEAEAFEERLAHDHSAREAVAEMVQLSELTSAALAAMPVTSASAARSHWVAPLAWMMAGAAACLTLVAALSGLASSPEENRVVKAPAPQVVAAPAPTVVEVDHATLVRRTTELRHDGVGAWHFDVTSGADDALVALGPEIQLDAEVALERKAAAA